MSARGSSPPFADLFVRLREILREHASTLTVSDDTVQTYCLEGLVGPATLKAWRGQQRRAQIPVAWIQIGKSGVSYHLMPLEGGPALTSGMSPALKAKMQGQTCFMLRAADEGLLRELDELTRRGVTGSDGGQTGVRRGSDGGQTGVRRGSDEGQTLKMPSDLNRQTWRVAIECSVV